MADWPEYLKTPEAARYLTEHGVPRTVSTLESDRTRKSGVRNMTPCYFKAGRQVTYRKADLDVFIASILSGPLASTSDQGGALNHDHE
jgi:hypothetical protein